MIFKKIRRTIAGSILFTLLALVFYSCGLFQGKPKEKAIAKVGNHYLYPSDLFGSEGFKTMGKDSVEFRKATIERWIRRQLLLEKAELNLTDEAKNVSKYIEDYRTSLLIYKYQQQLLSEKLDTVISKAEILKYYEQNPQNFLLVEPIVKAIFIKIAANIDGGKVKKVYKSDDEDDIAELESLIFQSSATYLDFSNKWVKLSALLSEIPGTVENIDGLLKYVHSLEKTDNHFNYYLYIREYKLRGEMPPVEFVYQDVSSILLNKRKIQFVRNLENDIYDDGLAKENVKIFE